MRTPKSLPQSILAKRVPLDRIGVAEDGWSRLDVRRLIQELGGTRTAILGGDVYSVTDDLIEPAYANWHSDPVEGELSVSFIARSHHETLAYVDRYPDPEDGSVLYVLVFKDFD